MSQYMSNSCPVRVRPPMLVLEKCHGNTEAKTKEENKLNICDFMWWGISLTKLRLWGFHCCVVIRLIKARGEFSLGTNRTGELALLTNNCVSSNWHLWALGQNVYLYLHILFIYTYTVIKHFVFLWAILSLFTTLCK